MITDTGAGQTNYCPMCEDQARRIEELERRVRMFTDAAEMYLRHADANHDCIQYKLFSEALNSTPSHSAAWEWNQHVEWIRNNLRIEGEIQGSPGGCYVHLYHGDFSGKEKFVAIPELKEM